MAWIAIGRVPEEDLFLICLLCSRASMTWGNMKKLKVLGVSALLLMALSVISRAADIDIFKWPSIRSRPNREG